MNVSVSFFSFFNINITLESNYLKLGGETEEIARFRG